MVVQASLSLSGKPVNQQPGTGDGASGRLALQDQGGMDGAHNLQGYLAHTEPRTFKTLQQQYA